MARHAWADQKKELIAAGRWDKFIFIREQLKNKGLDPIDARAEALRRLETGEDFVEEGSDAEKPVAEHYVPLALFDGIASDPSLTKAVLWASEHLMVREDDIDFISLPSKLAYTLWATYRSSGRRAEFLETYVKPLVAKEEAEHAEFEPDRDQTVAEEWITSYLTQTRRASITVPGIHGRAPGHSGESGVQTPVVAGQSEPGNGTAAMVGLPS